jgi:hypothetical protein
MRLPLEIAMEVGSFLDGPSLTVCTTQLCWSVVGFVSHPCTDSAKVTTVQLYKLVSLCRTASEAPIAGQEQADGLVSEAIKRIDLCLARRTSAEKVVFVFDLKEAYVRGDKYVYWHIRRHFQLSSNLQFENGPSLAVEWHARASCITAVAFLLGETTGGSLNDVSALASCPAVHKLDLSDAWMTDVSALASCQALHTLKLARSRVRDVSALVSCQALHKLNLRDSRMTDVSALASCQALHTLNLIRTRVTDVSALALCPVLHTLHLCRTQVCDVSALASCQALHTLDLSHTRVSDVSALASCQSLHWMSLDNTRVSDVSALASCQSLHTLYLGGTQVSDVSALAACESLRYVRTYKGHLGYGALMMRLTLRR